MQIHALVTAVLCLSLASAVGAAGDEQRDAERLEQLRANVEKVLPPGWAVETKLADPKIPTRRGSHPALVIRSDQPLAVEHFYPGMAARSVDEPEPPEISREIVAIQFVACPFMSQPSYMVARAANDTLRKRRLEFQREQLNEIPYAYKGTEPIPPYAFEPRNNDETQIIRQYAFLWVSTQPRALPTHYTDNLAFEIHVPGWIEIQDAKKSKEYDQVLDGVQKIIVPYEK